MPEFDQTHFSLDNAQALIVRKALDYWFDHLPVGLDHPDFEDADNLYQELGLFAVEPPKLQYRCPTTKADRLGAVDIIGCGSWNTSEPDADGDVDCMDCGIWFRPADELEIESRPRVAA